MALIWPGQRHRSVMKKRVSIEAEKMAASANGENNQRKPSIIGHQWLAYGVISGGGESKRNDVAAINTVTAAKSAIPSSWRKNGGSESAANLDEIHQAIGGEGIIGIGSLWRRQWRREKWRMASGENGVISNRLANRKLSA